jgi:5-formyltetrahydrofolate cyclo-ligase
MQKDDLILEKKRLRREAKEIIGSFPPDALGEASRKITEQVLSSPLYRQAASIFVYVSTEREPDTHALIEDAWRAGKMVYVPKCCGQGRMDAVRVLGWHDLVPGTYGIPEPVNAPADASFPDIDLAVVPCVRATADGKRLGHGAGYYDRFLRAHPMPCLCLCFHALLSDDLPTEPSDVPMSAVITEEGTFSH